MTPLPPPARPLALTGDPELLDDLLRLAAAGGIELTVGEDPAADRRAWESAPMVVVGSDVIDRCVGAGMPRRSGVVVVGAHATSASTWQQATALGADNVIFLPAAEPWLVARFTDSATEAPLPAACLAVVGGRGGAGATVLACALAMTAARRGLRPLLVDADPLGGGIDLVLGAEDAAGLRWPDLAATTGRVAPPVLHQALPSVRDLTVLSWDRGDCLEVPAAAMRAVLGSGRRGAGLVVVDLPRRVDEGSRQALNAATVALMVVPAEVRACAAAERVGRSLAEHCARLEVVVRGPAPGRLHSRDVAGSLGLPLAGVLRPEPGIARALDSGEPPLSPRRSPLAALSTRLIDRFAAAVPGD